MGGIIAGDQNGFQCDRLYSDSKGIHYRYFLLIYIIVGAASIADGWTNHGTSEISTNTMPCRTVPDGQ